MIKRLLPTIKLTVVVLSLAFLGHSLWNSLTPDLLLRLWDGRTACVLLGIAVVYCFALLLPALAWAELVLANRGASKARRTDLLAIYGSTLVAKYLPGNVFHLIGRQTAGASHGLRQSAVALATLYEALLMVSAGVGVSVGIGWLGGYDWHNAVPWMPPSVMILALCGGGLLPWLVAGLLWLGKGWWGERLGQVTIPLSGLALSWTIYAAFLAVSSLLLWGVAVTLGGNAPLQPILGLYSLIYILSYLAPGAPGGVGVREALIVLMLGPLLGNGVAGLAGLCLRLSMTMGELLLFGLFMGPLRSQAARE